MTDDEFGQDFCLCDVQLVVAQIRHLGVVHVEGQPVVHDTEGERVSGLADDQPVFIKGHIGAEDGQFLFGGLMGVGQVFLQLIDPGHGPGKIAFGLLGQGADLRFHLRHIAGQGVGSLHFLPDTVTLIADLCPDRGQLLFQGCLAVLRRGSVICRQCPAFQLDPVNGGCAGIGIACRFPINENITIAGIILRRFAAGVFRSECGFDSLGSDIIQRDGRKHLVSVGCAYRDPRQILHGDGQGNSIFLVFLHSFSQRVSGDEISGTCILGI